MRKSFGFLKVDLFIQRIFFALYFLAILSILFQPGSFLLIMILHFFVGLWQFTSCIIHISAGDGLTRKNYFLSVVFYFVLLGLFAALGSNGYLPSSDTLFMTGLGVLPMGLAIWYFILTTQEYQKLKKNKVPQTATSSALEDEILDENIWQ